MEHGVCPGCHLLTERKYVCYLSGLHNGPS